MGERESEESAVACLTVMASRASSRAREVSEGVAELLMLA
jgi:hypothetical protein